MNKLMLIPALLLASCAAYADEPVEPTGAAADRLAEAIGGRVAGEPVACVRNQEVRGSRIVDDRHIVWEGSGDTVYLNTTRSSCGGIRPWHALRRRTIGTAMCEGELVVAFDPNSGIEYGGCSLGEFVPYRRVG